MSFSEMLGITPPFDRSKEEIKRSKYCAIIILSLITIGTFITVYGNTYAFFEPRFSNTNAALILLSAMGLSFLNIVTVAVAAFNTVTWNNFLKLFKYFDTKLNNGVKQTYTNKGLVIEIILYHIVMFCIFGYDAYLWNNKYGWTIQRFNLPKYFNLYHSAITMLVIIHFASALRGRFKRINTLLVKSNDIHNIINNFISKGMARRVDNLKSIEEVTDNYLLLSEMVDIFNKLFGWQIFFITENIILLLLEFSNVLMLSIDSTQTTIDAFHDSTTIIFLMVLAVIFLVSIFFIHHISILF